MTVSGWDLASGFALADGEVEVIDCEFGYNPNLGDSPCANFTFTVNGEKAEQSFSVGNGMEITGKGARLEPEEGRSKGVNKQSNYGRLIGSVISILGDKVTETGVEPLDAASWIGTKWRTGTVKVTTRNPQTNVETEKDAIIFVEWLGRADGAAPAATGGGGASKPATGGDITDHALYLTLAKLAASAKDHDAFMEAALEVDGVAGDKAITTAIISTKPGSIWAEVK